MKKILSLQKVCKKFGDHIIFDEFNLDVYENEFVAIVGESGSGKSTLLNIIGLLESVDSGDIILFDKKNIKPFSRDAAKILRNAIGYLFQNFALIDDETISYNLNLAMETFKIKNRKEKIIEALKQVGLNGMENQLIYKCSGGEQQRIAIARLLVKPCELILADEPTGSLDEKNKVLILDLLLKLKGKGKTLIIVTHDKEIMKIADRVVRI